MQLLDVNMHLHLPHNTNNEAVSSLFAVIDNCCISKCPVSNPTNSIAMETVIMYVLMRGVEIDMEKGGDAVKHVSEYQSLSPAVNNDSTAALCLLLKPCWSLRESCQGNSE